MGIIDAHSTHARRAFHALRQRVGSQIEVGHHAVGLQAQEARTLREAPCVVNGIMVPLPVQPQFGVCEVISFDNGCLGLIALIGAHGLGHLAIFIANHRPAVDPAHGRDCKYAPYPTTILEDDAIPVAILTIDDGALSHVGESTKIALQDNRLLPRSLKVVGTVAHLTAMTTRGKDMTNHKQIVTSIMLDDAATFQEPRLVGLTLEHLAVSTLDNIGEVGLQLNHLARAIEHIDTVVIVEEERSIVEMAHARVYCPRPLGLRGGTDIGLSHGTTLVGSEERIELSFVIF